MKKALEYRKHADECRRMMATATNEQKALLETMPQTWETLAQDRERQMIQQRRISELEQLGEKARSEKQLLNAESQDPTTTLKLNLRKVALRPEPSGRVCFRDAQLTQQAAAMNDEYYRAQAEEAEQQRRELSQTTTVRPGSA